MPKRLVGFGCIVTLAISFSHTPLYAQTDFGSDSDFGPYLQQATLRPSVTGDDEFGERVALAGDVALVAGTGVVYVFERDPATDTWQEVAPIEPGSPVEGFGQALAFDKNTAIIGGQGAALVFQRMASGQWQEITTLKPGEERPNFGARVAISGNQAMVSAPADTISDDTPGVAYIFRRDSEGSADWKEVTILSGGPLFGYSVGITSETAIVAEFCCGPGFGRLNIFSRDLGGNDAWGLVRQASLGLNSVGNAAIHGDTAVWGGGQLEVSAVALILGQNVGGPDAWGGSALYGSRDDACCGFFTNVDIDAGTIILGFQGLGRRQAHILARNQGAADGWNRVALFDDVGSPQAAPAPSVSISGDTALLGSPGRSTSSGTPPNTDDNAVFVVVSDLDGDGARDGLDPCPRDPLNNVAGDCQRNSAEHPVLDSFIALSDLTDETEGALQFITATFTNTGTTAVKNPFFEVTVLTGGNVLLNADEGSGGVGATLSPDVGDAVLSPGESMTVTFRIRLRTQEPFKFFVAFHGDPVQ